MRKLLMFVALSFPAAIIVLVPHLALAQGTGGTFVPLSNIPALTQNVTSGSDLPRFLNNLYTICIGIAVVIAVLQLVRAGVTYTMVDSVTTKEEARHLISASLLGLLLVLSPYIVFSIVNPHILDLDISGDVGKLESGLQGAPGSPQESAQQAAAQAAAGTPTTMVCTNGSCADQASLCVSNEQETCQKPDGSIDASQTTAYTGRATLGSLGTDITCPSGETLVMQCNATISNASGAMGANGCTQGAPATGSEYTQVSCKTNEDAAAWNQQYCSGSGIVQEGVCTQGTNNSGQCSGGQEPTVTCLGVSQPFTFFQVSSDQNDAGFFQFRPVTGDLSAAEGFISSCPSGTVCFLAGSTADVGTCSADQYTRASGLSNPACAVGKLLCSEPQQSRCKSGAVVIGN